MLLYSHNTTMFMETFLRFNLPFNLCQMPDYTDRLSFYTS